MSRINRIEQQYISQITNLNNKLSLLETDNYEIKQENTRLQNIVFKLETEMQIM